jgi:23S rRNA pseudouridine2605 synthase
MKIANNNTLTTKQQKLNVRIPSRKIQITKVSKQKQIVNRVIRQQRISSIKDLQVRISKVLAMSGVGSRRFCDDLISNQQVLVNNKPAQLGQQIRYTDKIIVSGKPLIIKWEDRVARIIIYHKVEGEITTRNDPQQRITVFSKIPDLGNKRFVAIGRLDINTSGLLVFTTSGQLAYQMTHPKYEVQREYAVRVYGKRLTATQLNQLKTGVQLDDGIAKFTDIVIQNHQDDDQRNTWYRVVLQDGRNREVRRMFEYFNLTVSRLMRTRFGPIDLPARLKRGQYYELNESEVSDVMHQLNLNLAGITENNNNIVEE